jgi:ornithine cyclodeaminase
VRDPARTSPDAVAPPTETTVLALGGPDADTALGAADVVVCATSARAPLFDSRLLRREVAVEDVVAAAG